MSDFSPRDAVIQHRLVVGSIPSVVMSNGLIESLAEDIHSPRKVVSYFAANAGLEGRIMLATRDFTDALAILTTDEVPDSIEREILNDVASLHFVEMPELEGFRVRTLVPVRYVGEPFAWAFFLFGYMDSKMQGMFAIQHDPRYNAMLAALWLAQNPSLVDVVDGPVVVKKQSKAGRRHGKVDDIESIAVVDLRKRARDDIDQTQEAERTYRHRWIVRGHWHTFAYGPARSLRKVQFVMPYVKGPEGTPLLKSATVYRW